MGQINNDIVERIATLRKEKGINQKQIYEHLNITRGMCHHIETTGHIPIHQIPALSELFGVSVEYLVTGKETRTPTRLHDSGSIFATHEHRIISDEEMKIIHRVDKLSNESKKVLNDNLDKNESFFNDTDIKLLNDIYALDEHNKEFLIEFLKKLKKATD